MELERVIREIEKQLSKERIRGCITFFIFIGVVMTIMSFMIVERGFFKPDPKELIETYNWLLSSICQGLGAVLGILGLFSVFGWQVQHKASEMDQHGREAKAKILDSLKLPFVFGFLVITSSFFLLSIGSLLPYSHKSIVVLTLGTMSAISTLLVTFSIYSVVFRTTSGA